MDNEMIERMAIAIKEVQWGTRVAWEDCDETFKTIKRQQAIASAKAMREPTDKMKIAGSINPGAGGPDEGYETEVWQAMLDAIIGDE